MDVQTIRAPQGSLRLLDQLPCLLLLVVAEFADTFDKIEYRGGEPVLPGSAFATYTFDQFRFQSNPAVVQGLRKTEEDRKRVDGPMPVEQFPHRPFEDGF